MARVRPLLVLAPLLLDAWAAGAAAQELGHRIMGTLGSDAGSQPPPGLYLVNRLTFYTADRVRDRDGAIVPTEGLEIEGLANAIGAAATVELPSAGTYVSAALAFPIARLSVSADRPRASLDTWGFGDVYLKPLQLGWRPWQLDVVVSYAVYLPTGLFRLGEGGIGQGHVEPVPEDPQRGDLPTHVDLIDARGSAVDGDHPVRGVPRGGDDHVATVQRRHRIGFRIWGDPDVALEFLERRGHLAFGGWFGLGGLGHQGDHVVVFDRPLAEDLDQFRQFF